jgi:large subunit ribosomal protein L10
MPSAKILEQKKQTVADLAQTLRDSVAGVLVDYRGINVADDTSLRRELRAAGVKYSVVKNSILRRAAAEAELAELDSKLTGTTAIAVSPEDHTAAARILQGYAEKSKTFKLKGGYLDGSVIGLEMVENLAKLPTREVLLATVCNAFQAPIAAFARVIQAVIDNGGEAVEKPEETPAEETAVIEEPPAAASDEEKSPEKNETAAETPAGEA